MTQTTRKIQGNEGGELLARWLTKTRTTQCALAKRLGTTQGGVSALISGVRKPNVERRRLLFALAGIPQYKWDRAGATREVRVRA